MTDTKLFTARRWFQLVYSTKKSTSCCSRKFSHRTKFVSSSSIYIVQRQGWAAEACSQGDWCSGSPKEKDLCSTAAIQHGQPINLLCSIRQFGRKKEEEKFQQIVYVNCKLDEFVYPLDLKNSVYERVIAIQPIYSVLYKVIATIYYNHLFFLFKSGWVGTLEIIETTFSS